MLKGTALRLWRDESGQGLNEYVLIIALVAIGVIVTLGALSTAIRSKFQEIINTLNGAQAQ